MVEELGAIGLQSVYHQQTIEQQGQESTPTFFLQRNVEKSYHIDYVFVSEELLQFSYLQVGKQTMWLSLSDHMPMTLKIKADS